MTETINRGAANQAGAAIKLLEPDAKRSGDTNPFG